MKIEDGRGRNGDAGVSKNQRLDTSSRSGLRLFYTSRDEGLAYHAVYDGMTGTAGDIMAYLQSNSTTRNLFIDEINFGGVEAVKWRVFAVTGTAASGEIIMPAKLNLSKGIAAEATAMAGDTAITGLTTGDQIAVERSGPLNTVVDDFHGALILGPGNAIAVEYDTGTTGLCEIEIIFHFEDFDA